MDDNFIKKILENKFVLFLIPNLIFFSFYLNIYNKNFVSNNGQIFFLEIIILCVVTLFINIVLYLFLSKILKFDVYEKFLIISLFCIFLLGLRPLYYYFFGFIILVIVFKILTKLKLLNLKIIVYFYSFFIFFIFLFNLFTTFKYLSYAFFKSKGLNYDFKVYRDDNNRNQPNIYWIHCDATIGMDVMSKYFDYDNHELKEYFNKNNYFYNENARLVAGNSTRRALPALFNPYYYDNFFKDYLYDLEQVNLEKKSYTDYLVNYDELTDKRYHNELFKALKSKDYTTYGIGNFDLYTSLYTDYFYDYYSDYSLNFDKFRYLKYEDNKDKYDNYLKLLHISTLVHYSYLRNIINYSNIYLLKGKLLDYNDVDLEGYEYAKNTKDIATLTLFKGLYEIFHDSNSRKFVFLDYYLNHMPLKYDSKGEYIDKSNARSILAYKDNYIYSTHILIDILNYIKNNDSDSVIVVQADHGINVVSDDDIMNALNVTNEEVQEIRNSVINAVYVPSKYLNGNEKYLGNPLNISRYLVNSYVGHNYEYIEDGVD